MTSTRQKAKIELISRYVKHTKELYDHLFILFTFSNGVKQVIRGGAFNDKIGYEFIFIHSQNYRDSIDNCINKNYNCTPPKLLFEGSEKEVKLLHNTLLLNAEVINKGYYDYKLPDLRCEAQKLAGDAIYNAAKEAFKSICHLQNSNTAIAQILKMSNIQFTLPIRNGIPVNAIGYDQDLKHSAIDKVTGLLQMATNLNKLQGNEVKLDSNAAEALKATSDAYHAALVKQFDPIRQSQEKDLYPDNLLCCVEDLTSYCKQCDLLLNEEL